MQTRSGSDEADSSRLSSSIIFNKMDPTRQTLMRATAGHCGRDSAHCSLLTNCHSCGNNGLPCGADSRRICKGCCFLCGYPPPIGPPSLLRETRKLHPPGNLLMLPRSTVGSGHGCFPCGSYLCLAQSLGEMCGRWASSSSP